MRKNFVTVALAALALCAGAVAASAQSITTLYYQEVERDGRVYVFNSPERFQSWSASGEIGTAITLVGKAAGGKTLVAENETAADLYLFRHGLPGYDRPTPKPYAPPFEVGWKDGKTTIKSKSAELKLSNRVQVRFTEEDPEDGDGKGSFRIRRAKTKFEGWVYSKDLEYELQMNWADSSPLEDANFNYDFSHGDKAAMLKIGRFKVPFGRQELTSSGSQQFVDRSIVSAEFAKGRDNGLQLWGTPAGGRIDWRVGLFNGAGRTASSNDNDEYQYNARLAWQPFGDAKYSEIDFDSKDTPLFAVAAQFESNDKFGATDGDDTDREVVGADVVFKYRGLFAFAEFFDATADRETGASADQEGLHAQVGYLFAKKLDVALRYAAWDPDQGVADNDRTETGVALGYFWNKHNHKLQADYRQVEDDALDATNDEFRLQYQLIF
jgi:hypothetical protein